MYPTLLRDMLYPVKLRGYYRDMRPDDVVELSRGLGVIARVRVESAEAEYPQRTERGTRYPLGRFTSTLAGPDIVALAAHGRVVACTECAVYSVGRPFAQCIEALLEERYRADALADESASQFAKLVSNALAGKLAQRSGAWIRAAYLDSPGKWGEEHIITRGQTVTRRLRWVAGCAYEYVRDHCGRGPHTAAFAYLTAYGRQQMAAIRSACPARSIVSQDTDGVWALSSAVEALTRAGILAGQAPGRLRIKGSARTAIFLGPRHYAIDGQWTLSGLHDAVVHADGRRVTYTSALPLLYQTHREPPCRTLARSHTVTIDPDLEGGTVGEDGWILPPRKLSLWREEEGR